MLIDGMNDKIYVVLITKYPGNKKPSVLRTER